MLLGIPGCIFPAKDIIVDAKTANNNKKPIKINPKIKLLQSLLK